MAIHSKLSVVKLDTSGGVLTTISTFCNKFELPRSLDVHDVTTFGSTVRQYLAGFGDGEGTTGGPWTRALDNHMSPIYAAFQAGTIDSVSFEYGPEGSDTGDVKYSGELILTDFSGAKGDVGKPQEWDAKFKVTGVVTVSTY